ncbi:MAG: DegT/DnrJ/EryC1/StrS family aminotransferase [Thermodesulfobacteriota bacterium]
MKEKLALLGGNPVRRNSYSVHTTMIDSSEEEEVLAVLRSGHLSGFSARPGERFLGGPNVRRLEKDFAEYFGVDYAISFNSATSGLHSAISAAQIGPGDEVIVPPTTMSATASCVLMQNAIPVFADIEDETFGLDPDSVEAAITPYTKAILTVNLFGHPSRLEELKSIADRHNLLLIEDNAQSPGAKCDGRLAGTFGEMGVQSLNYHKTIQTGEGGVVLTNSKRTAEHLHLVRNHGEVVVGHSDQYSDIDLTNLLGWNYRLSEIQAAIGIHQLRKLDGLNELRIRLADLLSEELRDYDFLASPIVRPNCSHVYYLYPLRFFRERIGISREIFVKAMIAEGISISQGYVRPIYLEPMYQKRIAYGTRGCPFRCPWYKGMTSYETGLCPTAERLHFQEIIVTDICKYPNTKKEVEEFVYAVQKISHNLFELRKLED